MLGLTSICFSEKNFEIITFNKSSVGNSIPIKVKLLILDCKSLSEKFLFLIEFKLLITMKFSNCLEWFKIE